MFANAAIAPLFPHPIMGLLALVAVLVIETMILQRRLGVNADQVFIANALSAILGWLLCTVALDTELSVSLSRGGMPADVLLLMAAVVLPCFILSVLLEGAYLRRRAQGAERRAFWSAVIKANSYSYIALVVLDCLCITFGIS
jgi:hypothetical protein